MKLRVQAQYLQAGDIVGSGEVVKSITVNSTQWPSNKICKIGIVKRHMRSKFVNPYRYGSEMQHYITDAHGRWGYIVLIECEGEKSFWVDAEKVMSCCTKEW